MPRQHHQHKSPHDSGHRTRHKFRQEGDENEKAGKQKVEDSRSAASIPNPATLSAWSDPLPDPDGQFWYQARRVHDGSWEYKIMGSNSAAVTQTQRMTTPITQTYTSIVGTQHSVSRAPIRQHRWYEKAPRTEIASHRNATVSRAEDDDDASESSSDSSSTSTSISGDGSESESSITTPLGPNNVPRAGKEGSAHPRQQHRRSSGHGDGHGEHRHHKSRQHHHRRHHGTHNSSKQRHAHRGARPKNDRGHQGRGKKKKTENRGGHGKVDPKAKVSW